MKETLKRSRFILFSLQKKRKTTKKEKICKNDIAYPMHKRNGCRFELKISMRYVRARRSVYLDSANLKIFAARMWNRE